MKTNCKYLLLYVLGFILLNTQAFSKDLRFPQLDPKAFKVEKYKLSNGMTVLLYQDKSIPIAILYQWYRAGARQEKKGKTGLAHFLEHLLFRGTEKHEPYKFYSKKWGAIANATTGFDRTNYYVLLPKYFLEDALRIEADRMRHANFRKEIFELEKNAIKSERKLRRDDNIKGAFFEFCRETAFQTLYLPYSWTLIGTQSEIAGLNKDDVKGFYDEYYYPYNSVLVIAGHFEKAEVKSWIQKYYGVIKNDESKIKKITDYRTGSSYDLKDYKIKGDPLRVKHHIKAPYPMIQISYPIYEINHKDSPALGLLSMILGGKKLLYDVLVRKEKTALSVDVVVLEYQKAGVFLVNVALKKGESYERAIELVDREIEIFQKKGIDDKQLRNLKIKSYRNFISSFQVVSDIAKMFGSYETLYGDYKKPFEIENQWQAVTKEQILEVSKKYLKKPRQSVAVFLPHDDKAL